MRDNDFIVIQAPMVTKMGLAGNRLLVYAIIDGFCKVEGGSYDGGLDYLCQWTGLVDATMLIVLKDLVNKGLLFKVGDNSYSTLQPSDAFAPIPPIKKEKTEKKASDNKEELFEECWVAYRRKGSKKKALEQWKKIKEEDKELILRHIKIYVDSRELRYQKDFERYLRDNTFKDIIVRGVEVLYDPKNLKGDDEYRPIQSFLIAWDESKNINVYIGFWDGKSIPDGYDDNTRPDGARIMLNNARGTIVWSKAERKWNQEL